MLSPADENKIERLLELLAESRILHKRMEETCAQIERQLREALNATWTGPA